MEFGYLVGRYCLLLFWLKKFKWVVNKLDGLGEGGWKVKRRQNTSYICSEIGK